MNPLTNSNQYNTQHAQPFSKGPSSHHAKPSSASQKPSSSSSSLKKRGNDDHHVPSTVVDEKRNVAYSKGKLLGKGGFAMCYLFTNEKTDEALAGKVVDKSSLKKEKTRRKLLSEIKIHSEMDHPRVVKFLNFFEDRQHVYMVLELCRNHSMMELIRRRKRLTETEVRYYMAQLVEGVRYMHENKVIHRDLKLGNLFLTDKLEIKIGDFGLATKLVTDEDRRKTVCGTPNYIAPEVLDSQTGDGHSYEVDIWSLGVIMFTLLCGKPPFETSNVKSTYKRIRASAYTFPSHVVLSKEAKSLISWTLNREPRTRPSLEQLASHAFFNDTPTTIPIEALHRIPRWPGSSTTSSSSSDQQRTVDVVSKRMAEMRVTSEDSTKDAYISDLIAMQQSIRRVTDLDENRRIPSAIVSRPKSPFATARVTRWIDYTAKYGLGYQLDDGSVGVYFNDATKIILSAQGTSFDYVERESSSESSPTRNSHYLYAGGYPSHLEKKVVLLKHFRDYLEQQAKKEGDAAAIRTTTYVKSSSSQQGAPFVRKWTKTRHALFFRLSNRAVQIKFYDGSEIVLDPAKPDDVWYKSKLGEEVHASVEGARGRADVVKRLKYLDDVLSNQMK